MGKVKDLMTGRNQEMMFPFEFVKKDSLEALKKELGVVVTFLIKK